MSVIQLKDMTKKNYSLDSKEAVLNSVICWKPPIFHQASECYVSFMAFDPSVGRLRKKKIMLDHIKGKRNQKVYGEALIRRLTEKLMQGWNPWIELVQPLEYTSFREVCEKYKDYLVKLVNEHHMREESLASYTSRVNTFMGWVEQKEVSLFYTYQFDKHIVGQFLDYVFVERNNTVQTRNNYLAWLRTFSKYLLERGYISIDPTQSFGRVSSRQVKSRDVIPDEVLKDIHAYLEEKNKHYLLACYILHYLFVRPHEMSFLRIGDFSISKHTLRLHGDQTKNHNDAVVTLPAHVLNLMLELGVFNYPSHYYLFSNDFRPGEEWRSEKMYRDYWLHHLRKDLGFSSRYKFYSLKDTGITNMLRANTDILSVRDQARHSSILITDIYTPKDIKDANKLIMNYRGVL